LIGEPVPPVKMSGGPQKKSSYTLSSAQSSASFLEVENLAHAEAHHDCLMIACSRWFAWRLVLDLANRYFLSRRTVNGFRDLVNWTIANGYKWLRSGG
jgi:hypothetical protein